MTTDRDRKPTLLVALGGNALIKKGQTGSIEEQFENLKIPARQIARLSADYRIIITHGNGPQVGNLLLQQECCDAVPKLPLEILVAQTGGQLAYMIESTLDEALMEMGTEYRPLVSLITYVVVDRNDPAFEHPSKPIGPSFSPEKARALPYPTMETPKGHRRVVASPRPVTIVESREIRALIDMDFIVICCGGGGIPVIRRGRAFNGVDAVIDKDLASARLASELAIDLFVIATDVEGAMLRFGKADQQMLPRLTPETAARYLAEGHFGTGSMGPKIEAAAGFVRSGGKRAVITSVEKIAAAVYDERVGTQFMAG
ncbi:carbamate kinase [Desulfonema ishimotonii]|uniref:Carbamate kinase n=1 Tax=Desulfonema ishimotonii TaxID=45657 RepID=A0A401G4J5_9BACT|nr:carbamate kinase [Desulfonema ishimotonii]GBC64134.1 carbamate kinase [Desulfonema ishimotonii]